MKVVKFYMMQADNKQNSLEALNSSYIKMFCGKFGGCTTYTASGYYVGKGKIYRDEVIVCEIFVDMKKIFKDNKAMLSYFRSIARRYQKEAGQECVSVVIDGHAFIVE